MTDYISREAAIAAAFSANAFGNSAFRDVYDTVERIRMIPAADVVERNHGEWIKNEDGCLCCSLCGNPCEINIITGEFIDSPYCSECGAYMWGEL